MLTRRGLPALAERQVRLARRSHMSAPPWRHLPAQQGNDCDDEGGGYY